MNSGACTDTIASIATAPGSGGIGIIRISGSRSGEILSSMFRPFSPKFTTFVPRMLHYGHILDRNDLKADEGLAVFFPGPHSFTGEDCAELQTHGGSALLAALLESALSRGARMAERGEFTRRAFLNGRIDLSQAEAVAEIIAAPSPEGVHLASAKLNGLLGQKISALRGKLEYLRQRVCLAIDFPDEEGECLPAHEFTAITSEVADGIHNLLAAYERTRCWSEGALVVLVGQVNAGKSSLMNAFLGRPRAIVTEKPGTTRDYLEEQTTLAGMPIRLVDTAGLRKNSSDIIEMEGMRRGMELARASRCVLLVLDGIRAASFENPLEAFPEEKKILEELGAARCIAVWNKKDLAPLPHGLQDFFGAPIHTVCAQDGEGIEELCSAVRSVCIGSQKNMEGELAPNVRQAASLRLALAALNDLNQAVSAVIPPDLCSIHLETASAHLADITGLNSTEETLNSIFSSFCIGK